ncbi:MAG: T9SS type A sorting domain-containing protein, partial [Bacteroidota bacterium]
SVMVTDASGCTGTDMTVLTTLTNLENEKPISDPVIYPNPCHGILYLKNFGLSGGTIKISDVSGRTVLEKTITDLQSEAIAVPLDGIAPGVYSATLVTTRRVITRTFVYE